MHSLPSLQLFTQIAHIYHVLYDKRLLAMRTPGAQFQDIQVYPLKITSRPIWRVL